VTANIRQTIISSTTFCQQTLLIPTPYQHATATLNTRY